MSASDFGSPSLIEEQYQAAVEQRRQWDREDRLAVRVSRPAPVGPTCDECHAMFVDGPHMHVGDRCPRRFVDGCVGVLR